MGSCALSTSTKKLMRGSSPPCSSSVMTASNAAGIHQKNSRSSHNIVFQPRPSPTTSMPFSPQTNQGYAAFRLHVPPRHRATNRLGNPVKWERSRKVFTPDAPCAGIRDTSRCCITLFRLFLVRHKGTRMFLFCVDVIHLRRGPAKREGRENPNENGDSRHRGTWRMSRWPGKMTRRGGDMHIRQRQPLERRSRLPTCKPRAAI